jgi:hypothetical protein
MDDIAPFNYFTSLISNGVADTVDDLIIERIPIRTNPHGGFIYALHIPDTNHVVFGLGYRSMHGLQISHIPTSNVHQFHVHEAADKIREEGIALKLGKLAELFTADPDAKTYRIEGDLADEFADAIVRVHNEAWGDPNAWEPFTVPLADGRVVWVMYDDASDRIRMGLGYIAENDEPELGQANFMLSSLTVSEFAAATYRGRAIIFYTVPTRAPSYFDRYVSHISDLRAVAGELMKLAESVWGDDVEPLQIQED